jgi:Ulp1 family protease
VFQLDKVFIPVNIANTHWTMAVVLVSRKEIDYRRVPDLGSRNAKF